LRKAIVVLTLMGALLAPAAAQAISLKGYLRGVTFNDAKRLANRTNDAEKYGAGHCASSSDGLHAKCIGVVAGHSVNPADPAQTSQVWSFKFIERAFLNPRSGHVRVRVGANRCFGPGCPYVQRHK
jgi:hypothetical protein